MAFCRSCGDIVTQDRCKKCGGLPAEPSVRFGKRKPGVGDSWSKTYVQESVPTEPESKPSTSVPEKTTSTNSRSRTASTTPVDDTQTFVSRTANKFPRRQSHHSGNSLVGSKSRTFEKIQSHINSVTSSRPLKHSVAPGADTNDGTTIVKSHVTGALVKVYGTVLGRPETLKSFMCNGCSMTFLPDQTIYPSPSEPGRYLCQDCFRNDSAASRGTCEECHKPVYALVKEEGGKPVENAGRIWHPSCFRCTGCGKDISKSPMVDITGKPCCETCFDECLRAGSPSPKRHRTRSSASVGGVRQSAKEGSPSREGSPVVEELELRLGITKSISGASSPVSRDVPKPTPRTNGGLSPTIERLTKRLDSLIKAQAEPLPPTTPSPPPPPRSEVATTSSLSPLTRSLVNSSLANSLSTQSSSSMSPSVVDSDASSVVSAPSTAFTSVLNSPPSPSGKDLLEDIGASGFDADDDRSTTPSITPIRRSAHRSRPSLIPTFRGTPDSPRPLPIQTPRTSETSISSLPLGRESVKPRWSTPSSVLNISPSVLSGSTLPEEQVRSPLTRAIIMMDSPLAKVSTLPRVITPQKRVAGTSSKLPTPSTLLKGVANITTPPSGSQKVNSPRTPSSLSSPLHKFTTPEALLNAKCDGCARPLLVQDMRGRIVTVPKSRKASDDDDQEVESVSNRDSDKDIHVERYHHACFRCATCGDNFGELDGRTNFVRENGKAVHVSCASPLRTIRKEFPVPSNGREVPKYDRMSTVPPNSKIQAPKFGLREKVRSSPRAVTPPAPVSPVSSGRFACGGCRRTVFQMEKGVVPGPQGSKWHLGCLVCGGKDWRARKEAQRLNGDPQAGCGKKLDSQARSDRDGQVWCNECLLMLPAELRARRSPSRGALQPNDTGNGGKISLTFSPTPTSGGRVGTLVTQFTGGSTGPLSPSSTSSSFAFPDVNDLAPLRTHFTGTRSASPVRRQFTGTGSFVTSAIRTTAPLKMQSTGGNILSPQTTGGVSRRPISVLGIRSIAPLKTHATGEAGTSPLEPRTTSPLKLRPKSVLGIRSSGISNRGIKLVQQMTGGNSSRS
ncbi:uncharacterized protein EI90DRAFT_3066356 [Cantharellus anzutake]|uniref:uncharacterized protein n=1 Tax=Cantharellus anzutake TaxID=1750568 RepID=UPI00190733E8|nr:uncharacterized protein EI90DRAFT_3066356 [Cantharellus anzutake]KAF8327927.1 hypothetical protein EI90DRAFT_3066356 [Cantharellus anzutake]